MVLMFDENKVTMTLGQFLIYRDALKFQEELIEIALNSRKTYGNRNERDCYEIGHAVLNKLDISEVIKEANDEN